MDDDLMLPLAVFFLALAGLSLARRVHRLEQDLEDADLASVKTESGTLLDAKRQIERRAITRAQARGRRS